SNGSESSLVEAIAHLIEASLRWLPLEYDVNVQELEGVRGKWIKKRVSLKWKQYEVAYVKSNRFILHGLVQEKSIKYYLPISKAKIHFCDKSLEEVEGFVHILLTLRMQKDKSKELSEVDLLMTRIAELEYIIEENTKHEA
ncbi:33567_t:CDS:2, partial [Racocetra persica]